MAGQTFPGRLLFAFKALVAFPALFKIHVKYAYRDNSVLIMIDMRLSARIPGNTVNSVARVGYKSNERSSSPRRPLGAFNSGPQHKCQLLRDVNCTDNHNLYLLVKTLYRLPFLCIPTFPAHSSRHLVCLEPSIPFGDHYSFKRRSGHRFSLSYSKSSEDFHDFL